MSYPEHLDAFRRLFELLQGRKTVVVGHVRPDADCIGSQVAMTRLLRASGVDAVALNAHFVPRNCLAFLGDTPFFGPEQFDWAQEYIVVSVDCASSDRFGMALDSLKAEVFANVDHHISNPDYARHNFVHPEACATAEVLAEYAFMLDFPVDPVTAQALYVGIAGDTGQFRHGNLNERVFRLCARLIDHGADPVAAALSLYGAESRPKLKLLGRFLNSLTFHCDNRVCIGQINDADWLATGADKEDSEGFVDYARNIDGVEIGIFLEQMGDQSKGSMRCKDASHRLDLLAVQFNGGGHPCAAGFNPHEPIESFYPRLLQALEAHFASIND